MLALASPGLTHAGDVEGVVVLTTSTPTTTPALILRDRHVCGAAEAVQKAWLDLDGEGANGVVVYVDGVAGRPPRSRRVEIDQVNCTYVPRVVALPVRSRVRFKNSDALLHNVHLFDPEGRTVANYAMPAKGQTTGWVKLAERGRYRVGCDAGHVWMNAHLFVFDHPFFDTTKQGGAFRIRGVAHGRRRVIVWHPDLGERAVEVDVPVKGSVRLRVEL